MNMNNGFNRLLLFLVIVFSLMTLIGTIGLLGYLGDVSSIDSDVIAYLGLCVSGSISLAILVGSCLKR